jgi:hypothetical protein
MECEKCEGFSDGMCWIHGKDARVAIELCNAATKAKIKEGLVEARKLKPSDPADGEYYFLG